MVVEPPVKGGSFFPYMKHHKTGTIIERRKGYIECSTPLSSLSASKKAAFKQTLKERFRQALNSQIKDSRLELMVQRLNMIPSALQAMDNLTAISPMMTNNSRASSYAAMQSGLITKAGELNIKRIELVRSNAKDIGLKLKRMDEALGRQIDVDSNPNIQRYKGLLNIVDSIDFDTELDTLLEYQWDNKIQDIRLTKVKSASSAKKSKQVETLVIRTKPIWLHGINFGEMDILLNIQNPILFFSNFGEFLKVRPLNPMGIRNKERDKHWHPHVGVKGAICTGDGYELIQQNIDRLSLISVIDIIVALLHTYNPKSPYRSMKSFFNEAIKLDRVNRAEVIKPENHNILGLTRAHCAACNNQIIMGLDPSCSSDSGYIYCRECCILDYDGHVVHPSMCIDLDTQDPITGQAVGRIDRRRTLAAIGANDQLMIIPSSWVDQLEQVENCLSCADTISMSNVPEFRVVRVYNGNSTSFYSILHPHLSMIVVRNNLLESNRNYKLFAWDTRYKRTVPEDPFSILSTSASRNLANEIRLGIP